MSNETEESSPVPEVRRIRCRSEVKWFDNRRGFGFIVSPEGKDVFVHYSNIRQEGFRTLQDGSQVEYTPVEGDKGLYAEDVVLIDVKPRKNRGGRKASSVSPSKDATPSTLEDDEASSSPSESDNR